MATLTVHRLARSRGTPRELTDGAPRLGLAPGLAAVARAGVPAVALPPV